MRCSRRMRAVRAGGYRARRLDARGAARKRQQGDIPSAFDGHAQSPLVPRAHAGHAAGQNLAALLDKLRQNVRALVVDEVHLLDAKLADFLLAEILALPTGTPPTTPGTCRLSARTTATRSTFTPTSIGAGFPPRSSTRRWRLFLFL